MGRHKVRELTPTKPIKIAVGTTLAAAEAMLVEQAVVAAGGNYEFASELLGVSSLTAAKLYKAAKK